jgi:hypothetical protein
MNHHYTTDARVIADLEREAVARHEQEAARHGPALSELSRSAIRRRVRFEALASGTQAQAAE